VRLLHFRWVQDRQIRERLDLWDSFVWFVSVVFLGSVAVDFRSFFDFCVRSFRVSLVLVCIWIWKFSFPRRNFGHLRDCLCRFIGNRICWGCIYGLSAILACPKT
jgi:hypothetical protein